jgi:hypothetical protein
MLYLLLESGLVHQMPRKIRIDAPGAVHYIIIRGIERKTGTSVHNVHSGIRDTCFLLVCMLYTMSLYDPEFQVFPQPQALDVGRSQQLFHVKRFAVGTR